MQRAGDVARAPNLKLHPLGSGVLHAWGRKRPRHAAADEGMTRNLVQRAGDVASAPNLKLHPLQAQLNPKGGPTNQITPPPATVRSP